MQKRPVGGVCSHLMHCNNDLKCDYDLGRCHRHGGGIEGDSCRHHVCDDAYFCNDDNLCQDKVGTAGFNEACYGLYECTSGLECQGASSYDGTAGTCLKTTNQDCGDSSECARSCENNKCTGLANGASCDLHNQCLLSSACFDGECEENRGEKHR